MILKVTAVLTAMMILGGIFILAYGEDTSAEDNSIDVFLIAGQSNAAYTSRADPVTASPVCPLGVAYYFGSETSPEYVSDWESTFGIHDMVNADGTAKIGGIEQPFSATYHKITGHKICIINIAIGGSSITKWIPTGSYYALAQDVFSTAMDSLEEMGFSPNSKGLIWLQGESDPTMAISTYKSNFMSMMNGMDHTSESFFNDTYTLDNCIIGLVRQETGKNSCIAQIQLDAEYENIKLGFIGADTFTVANGLLQSDNLHYTQKGRNVVAVSLAEKYVELFEN